MMILNKILAEKRKEVEQRKLEKSIDGLKKEPFFNRNTISLRERLSQSKTGIIAEFKRKSPSKGWLNENADAIHIAKEYCKNGASGISILTDYQFFGGSPQDLISARLQIDCPVLRKDFIIDEYQLFEAKAMGADVILLIAAAFEEENEVIKLAKKAKELNLEVLLEVHNKEELRFLNNYIDIVGVNNRNLQTFNVSLQTSKELSTLIPKRYLKISESGISSPEVVKELQGYGFQGFLIGERFMKENNPANKFSQFLNLI